ncbi:hypothetical protein ACFLRN_09160 [Thermoproteota archaeon]
MPKILFLSGRNLFVLIVVVNILIITFGGFLAYSDLYLREYSTRNHESTSVIEVEYSPLGYRPTYEYFDKAPKKTVVTRGSLTLDFFQLSVLVMAIADVLWFLSK